MFKFFLSDDSDDDGELDRDLVNELHFGGGMFEKVPPYPGYSRIQSDIFAF
jgi:hypothetical protein